MNAASLQKRLKSLGNPESLAGMSRVGIEPGRAYGVSIPNLRLLAKEIGRNHDLAGDLWAINNRETRILAAMIGEPAKLTVGQMESWAADFWDWEVCDQCCANLFEKTPMAWDKAAEWSDRPEEFVKRAGFVLMARLAVSDKRAGDEAFRSFFPLIVRESTDERNVVKKAVNWALRQIGKRNPELNREAIRIAGEIRGKESKAARWVAADALRELRSQAVQKRLADREKKKKK